MQCKHCEYEMGVIATYNILGNDFRMGGDYCSRKCMDERRASLSPFKDSRWDKKDEVQQVQEVQQPVVETPSPVVNQDAVAQGFEGFFNTPDDDEDENPLSKLFG